jgi:hypothetical protein
MLDGNVNKIADLYKIPYYRKQFLRLFGSKRGALFGFVGLDLIYLQMLSVHLDGAFSGCGWRRLPQILTAAANITYRTRD